MRITNVIRRLSCIGVILFSTSMLSQASSTSSEEEVSIQSPERESLFPGATQNLMFSHFTWGGEVGGSIDLTGHDMSTFDIDAMFGYKNDYIRILGIGVGVQKSFGANNMFVPLYAVFRSSFRKQPSLLFFNIKVGYSFNTIEESPTYGDISASMGLGINLAMSKRFQSHILLNWGFRHFTNRHKTNFHLDTRNINMAQIGFGVNF